MDTPAFLRLLSTRALPLSQEGMEKAQVMTEGSLVVVHRRGGGGAEGGQGGGAVVMTAGGGREGNPTPQTAVTAVTAFRGRANVHLFVTEVQAAAISAGVEMGEEGRAGVGQ